MAALKPLIWWSSLGCLLVRALSITKLKTRCCCQSCSLCWGLARDSKLGLGLFSKRCSRFAKTLVKRLSQPNPHYMNLKVFCSCLNLRFAKAVSCFSPETSLDSAEKILDLQAAKWSIRGRWLGCQGCGETLVWRILTLGSISTLSSCQTPGLTKFY